MSTAVDPDKAVAPGIGYDRSGRVRKYVAIALSGGLVGYVVWSVDMGNFWDSLARVPWIAVGAILLLLGINFLLVSLRLHRILVGFGYQRRLLNSLRASATGLLSSLFLINLVGSVFGRHVVLKGEGVDVTVVAMITGYERIMMGLVGLVALVAGGFILFGDVFVRDVLESLNAINVSMGIAAVAVLNFWILRAGLRARSRPDLPLGRIAGNMAEAGGWTVLAFLFSWIAFLVALRAVGAQAGIMEMLAAAAVVSFIAALPISVNGWGIREVASIFTFGHLGVAAPEAVAVSVLIGLCSTVIVLASAGLLLIRRRPSAAMRFGPSARASTPAPMSAQHVDRFSRHAIALLAAALVFFQVRANVAGGEITVNLADPFALLAFSILAVSLLTLGRMPVALPRVAVLWIVLLSVLLLASFLLGASRFGVTPWALNNRLFGWLVLVGYFTAGALVVGALGVKGLRRLCEVLTVSAAAVTVAAFAMQTIAVFWEALPAPPPNLEGFAANRNAFAFQLVVALCCGIAVSRARAANAAGFLIWCFLLGVIIFGLWETQSKTGFVAGTAVMVVALAFNLAHRKCLLTAIGGAVAGVLIFLAVQKVPLDNLFPASAPGGFAPGIFAPRGFDLVSGLEPLNAASVLERWMSIREGIAMWLGAPVFGAGLGAFTNERLGVDGRALVIHSTPVWILAEFGVVGLVVALVVPMYGLYRAALRYPNWRGTRTVLLICLAVGFGLFSLPHDVSYQRIAWLVLGAGLASALNAPARTRLLPERAGWAMRPPFTLHVITSLNRGGAETQLLALARHQAERGRTIVVSLLPDGALAPEFRTNGVEVHSLGFGARFPNPLGLLRLARLIAQSRPDIVQGWLYHGDLAATLGLYLSGRRRETGLVWGVRCSDMDLRRYSWKLRLTVRACVWLSSLPDAIVANSEAGRTVHRALGYRNPRFDVIHNGIDTERFRPDPARRLSRREALGLPADARVLAHVARVDPMKDHEGLLRALDRVPDLWVVLVGRGTETFAGRERVVALGQTQDVPSALAAADGIVSSSAYGEGFSNAICEGMAAGLVPVVTDVGDSAAIVGEVGWVVPPGDEEALAAALRAFRDTPPRDLAALGMAARARVEERFAPDMAERRFADLHRQLVGRRGVSEAVADARR